MRISYLAQWQSTQQTRGKRQKLQIAKHDEWETNLSVVMVNVG